THSHREQVTSTDGRYVTLYSGEPTAAATDNSYPVSSKIVIREITYDIGLARQAVLQVFLASMVVLALLLPVVFWIASRLLQKQLVDPLFNLRGEAGAIAQGDLTQAIANTERGDEIGQLAKSFARCATRCARPFSTSSRPTSRSSASCRALSWQSSASRRSSRSSWATTSAGT
ncbi:MAG TPA: HAMP domain-containing protein, partial [Reyranella sp.]|nr:HAMP domain-containing protein [Reyranella sp.]